MAPTSSSITGPVAVTMWAGRAGRSIPSILPSRNTAAAIVAPVEPALTTASASPSLTRLVATTIEEPSLGPQGGGGMLPHADHLGRIGQADVLR